MSVILSSITTSRMTGTRAFWKGRAEATDKLWGELQKLQKEERAKGGVLDMETEVVSHR